jgi:hypothetical protein
LHERNARTKDYPLFHYKFTLLTMLTSTSHERKLQETQVVHHFHRGTGVDSTHCIEGKAEKLLEGEIHKPRIGS